MKRKKILIYLILFAVLIAINVYTFANKISYPEPEDSKAPKHLVWNPDTGGYYNPDKYEWDENRKKYVDKNRGSLEEASTGTFAVDNTVKLWLEQHKDSSDVLEKAIVKYFYKKQEIPFRLPYASFFDGEEEALKILTDLGPAYLPDMKNMLANNDIWTVQMMYSINHITNIKNENMIYSTSPEVKKIWIQEYENHVSTAPGIVQKSAEKLKMNPDDSQAKEEIINRGIFALPYIADEFKKGNYELAILLPELTNQKETASKDIDYWTNWIDKNSSDIEIAKDLTRTVTE